MLTTQLNASMGDITLYDGDAIVNAANTQLMEGGGVCGAIFAAAGRDALRDACDEAGSCPTGSARATAGFSLPARFVIHAVGPVYDLNRSDNADLLASAYTSALSEAIRIGARRVAFPAISTGIYGFPLEAATQVAVQAVSSFCAANPGVDAVDFICFGQDALSLYRSALESLSPANPSPSA
jgi:O-acetyl-ADP-ribose deacetylase (regulator of RNase III)